MAEKDDPGVRWDRIRRIAAEVIPASRVVFDSEEPFSWIKFRLEDAASGQILGVTSDDYHASEIAD
jgi:hypothetical protein